MNPESEGAATCDRRGPLNEARCTEGRNRVKDCDGENFVLLYRPCLLAQLRRAAAGLAGSAAQPANGVLCFSVVALHFLTCPCCAAIP